MRMLLTLPYLPWPVTTGGKARQYHLIRSLASRGYHITLLVQSKTVPDESALARFEPLVERLIVLPRRALTHPKSLAAAALGSYPLLVSVNGHAPRLTQAFERLVEEPWDVVQIEHSYALQPFWNTLHRRQQAFVLTEHNIESAMGQAVLGRRSSAVGEGFRLYDQWRYRRWERQVLRAPRRLVAVTDDDARTLSKIAGRDVDVVVNGVDCSSFEVVQPDLGSRRLLFVGNYEYAPNLDAVEWMMREILPRAWARMPDLRCTICGHALPESWSRQWNDGRIEWRGYAQDLRTEQQRAALFFAPLRAGGGSKLKVLEAMAAGLAVIGTAQAFSGLGANASGGYRAAESAEALANELVASLEAPAQLREMGAAARGYVRRHHDWSIAATQLESVHHQLSESS